VSYRFKRSRLDDWRDIDEGVMDLVKRFEKSAGKLESVAPPPPNPAPAAPIQPQAQTAAPAPPVTSPAESQTWTKPPTGTPGAPGPDDLRPETDDGPSDGSSGGVE
jgi:hypothetical protein